jgi:DNA polymerase (family 10)
MQNQHVAYLLHRIARLLEMKGENEHKVSAYQRAARAIAQMDENLEKTYRAGRLQDIDGVGRHLEERIAEIVTTGSSGYLNELELEVPPELAELALLPGIGIKTVTALFQHTTIRTPEELYQAMNDKSLPMVPGLGKQAISRIRRALSKWEAQGDWIDLGTAVPVSHRLLELVNRMPYVEQASIVGDLRRGVEMVKEIVILAAAPVASPVIDFFQQLPFIKEVLNVTTENCRVKVELGMSVELRVVSPATYALEQLKCTGASMHIQNLAEMAVRQGKVRTPALWEQWLNSCGLKTEEELYRYHDLAFIPPEIREDGRELAINAQVLNLIKPMDIKGDLHMHTVWSDGYNTIEEMARKAKQMGYEYIAICDHSKSLSIAGGLDEARLRRQQAEIASLNQKNIGITILSGVELDILPDRRLDFSDDVLQELDIVVGSIHSGFKQDAQTITARIELAMKNEHVDIIAHPTGRMLRRRPGYQLDLERIFKMAVNTGTALEINASPDRLDLRDIHVRQAQEYGCKLVINTDAHDVKHLSDISYGVTNARRGWAKADHVLNTLDINSLSKYLAHNNYSLML